MAVAIYSAGGTSANWQRTNGRVSYQSYQSYQCLKRCRSCINEDGGDQMSELKVLRKAAKSTLLAATLLSFIGASVSAQAESREVRIALQFGIAYLPLT